MISAQTARRAVWRPLWELPGRLDLIGSLARREVAARYKGSVLGILWAIVTPVVTIATFTLIFAGMFGAAWLVASLGVFLRDIVQGVALLLMVWMYLTPIIYPESIVPERFRPYINANPFTPLIRSYRNIMLEGSAPDWRGLAYFTGF